MSRTAWIAAVAIVLAAGLYLAGYLPEHNQRVRAGAELQTVRADLSAAERRERVGRLLGQVLMLKELTARADYGQALRESSRFFDAVREETQSTSDGAVAKSDLIEVLAKRDAVTAALAKADPAVTATLTAAEHLLRRSLGYPVPAEPPAAAPPTNP